MLITLQENIVENWATLHFAQFFLLFQMSMFTKKILSIISGLENGGFGFLEIFQNQFFLKKTWYILYSIENFKGYPNHYMVSIQLTIFVEKTLKYFVSKLFAATLHIFNRTRQGEGEKEVRLTFTLSCSVKNIYLQ